MKTKIITATLISFLCITFTACDKITCCPPKINPPKIQKSKPGIYVKNGVLMRNEKPYRGIGVNYFDAFYRVLKNSNDTSYVQGFEQLNNAGIPFVRFMCGGFWPVEFKLYFSNKKAYFNLLDDFVKTAEKNNVGLIPSMFWYFATVPDMMNEPMDQLGNPESKSIAFIKQYTKEIVNRYKNSPAVWGWELGNEYNLGIDLPNASKHRPWVWPNLGTATNRTTRDELTSRQMLVVMNEFAKTVRKYDKTRIVITGNAVPPWYAYHNTLERSWMEDTLEQYEKILLRDNPNPFDVISIHVYPVKDKKYAARAKNISELLEKTQKIAKKMGKPLFIGEFGVPVSLSNEINTTYSEFITAIEKYEIPLAALWVYDYENQNKDWNVNFKNNRTFMLNEISKINKKLTYK
ncbi:MAG: hypothetical protein DRI44_03630 [Chlamydiae bacterium]|nr:MAG: hypothetical protein DRI44_03630 [Chlamydiota bacterium]